MTNDLNKNGTGMVSAPNSEPSGAVTSQEVGRKKPSQGKFKSGIENKRVVTVDKNRHGIRRETSNQQVGKKTRPKKV
jgi:hypothetical protein